MNVNRFASLLGMALVAVSAHAGVIFDNTGTANGTTYRSAEYTPALSITNTNGYAVNLTDVSFLGQVVGDQNLKFFLADSSGNILSSVTTFHSSMSGTALVGASVNWTLSAGSSYYIGAEFDGAEVDFAYTFPLSSGPQNGLVSGTNGNFNGYNSPLISGGGGADMAWVLEGGKSMTAAPAPAAAASFALLALRRRKKSQ